MESEVRLFKRTLRENGHFVTKPRLRLFKILISSKALSANELISRLPRHDRATVYRNINVFEKLGIINKLWLGWNSKIELSDIFIHHHHHLTCLKCGRVTALPDDRELEKRITRFSQSKKFKQTDHQLEIRGICRNCQLKITS